jgi:hypothetical protein
MRAVSQDGHSVIVARASAPEDLSESQEASSFKIVERMYRKWYKTKPVVARNPSVGEITVVTHGT